MTSSEYQNFALSARRFRKVLTHCYAREFHSVKPFLSIQLLNKLWIILYWSRIKPSTINISVSPGLQLKRISSLHRLRFGRPNNFTVSGNPISVSFPFLCHLAQIFFVNKKILTKRITVLGDLPRRWHTSVSDSWNWMSFLTKTSSFSH